MKTFARERDRAEILRRLKALRTDNVRQWGRMSVHQMVCHLNDSFRIATGQVRVSASTERVPRGIIKWFALYVPLRWPQGIATRPEIDQIVAGTKPVDFAGDLAQLVAFVETCTARRSTFEWPPHPIFGRMSEADWLRWAYLQRIIISVNSVRETHTAHSHFDTGGRFI